ncbi:MAG: DUF1638 domain-containing protein [Methanomassiliicoccales archaeon]
MNSYSCRLGIIGCPILENEIVYLAVNDKDISQIIVIRTEESRSLLHKLSSATSAKIICIEEGEIHNLKQVGYSLIILMKSMALHEDPQKLRGEVMQSIKQIAPVCDSILLFYGLCGNAFRDLTEIKTAAGKDLFILADECERPVDDCIAAVLGGTEGYYRLLKRYPGVFYLTPEWAEHWRELIFKMELTRGAERGDLSVLKWIFELAGYKKALKIDTGLGDKEEFERSVAEFAREFNFELGSLEKEFITLDAIVRSYDKAKKCALHRN